ncbi:Carbonyl reductase [NADPH] 3 [Holothuria leucospilota]|uniref:Carbonyl reductase [NADPH] 3 n=1 Tax=Holothuria leucospilota TaxID=206669 RepID=A0A9Q0YGG6_HOLLE|nr:Carbonyl reductase [NADPH] 3 [Holothuria leucospilota]
MPRVAVVTGSNKGIGFAIVRALCKKLDSSDVVYLTSRDETRGQEAVKKLEEEGLHPLYHQLDIADEQSVHRLCDHLQKTHGGLDILVNNAGIQLKYHVSSLFSPVWFIYVFSQDLKVPFVERAERTLKTNFFDTVRAYNILIPAVRSHGRVVFVASGLGHRGYQLISSELQTRFRGAKTEEAVQELMEKYLSDVKAGIQKDQGWQEGDDVYPPYNTSKLGIITLAKVCGEQMANDPREDILVNSCCPGFVDTDLTEHMGHRTVDEGAVTSVYLALIPPNSEEPQGRCIDPNVKLLDFLWK